MSQIPQYWYWSNVLDLKNIKKINKFISSNYDSLEDDARKAKDLNNISKKNTETYLITYKKIKPYISKLIDCAFTVNSRNFGYDLFNIKDLTGCNYNIYKSSNNANYDWHTDCSLSPYDDIKLTLIINLSEKQFEGGDFYLQTNNEIHVKELKEIGSMIMFTSHSRHTVTPVLTGERRNLSIFLEGPKFK